MSGHVMPMEKERPYARLASRRCPPTHALKLPSS
jgi:hypothetical protein